MVTRGFVTGPAPATVPLMPETPQQWYSRVRSTIDADGYRDSDLQQWSSWPWTGDLTAKDLQPPQEEEPPRRGAGGEGCASCLTGADPATGGATWWDEEWYLSWARSSSLPFAAFLVPRSHGDLADLDPRQAARQGELLTALEQTACAVLDVPRIQVARWGDGGEHLHWWLYARPTGMLQLRGTFLSHWDDLLPEVPAELARDNARLVASDLVRRVGGQAAGDIG